MPSNLPPRTPQPPDPQQHPNPQHPDSRGYYRALHLSPDASQQEISRAFRALIRVRHPDVGHSGGQTGDDVRSILAAFAVLRNPRTRTEYDRAEHAATGRIHVPRQDQCDIHVHDSPLHDSAVHDSPGREVPVRIVRQRGPLLRVSPVRWERGPG